MRYTVTLERGSDAGYMAWVHELPGCVARGVTREEVESKIAPEIAEFLAWAQRAHLSAQGVEFAIVGEVTSAVPARDADSEILLEPDRTRLTQTFWSQVERLLRLSRQELLHMLAEADEATLSYKPEGSPRSIREHCLHIGLVELMYAAWTFDLESSRGVADFLRWTRRIITTRMRALVRSDHGTMTLAFWSGAPRPEPWTARKAARRLVWHERLHLRAIRRLLTRQSGPHQGRQGPDDPSHQHAGL